MNITSIMNAMLNMEMAAMTVGSIDGHSYAGTRLVLYPDGSGAVEIRKRKNPGNEKPHGTPDYERLLRVVFDNGAEFRTFDGLGEFRDLMDEFGYEGLEAKRIKDQPCAGW